jgi:cell division septation protein DedD
MLEQQDTEIVLGTGKLLGIFFGLVIVCGIFFGLGFTFGRSSGPMTLQNNQSTTLTSGPGQKRGAGVTVAAPTVIAPTAVPETAPGPNTIASDQTEQAPKTDQMAADNSAAPVQPAPQVVSDSPAPELAQQPAPGAITVQVAAVTKQEDAQALVSALRRKNYPVFVASNAAGDNLYHVQVGPFGEMKDAEAMRSKLVGDGYNAILKK